MQFLNWISDVSSEGSIDFFREWYCGGSSGLGPFSLYLGK